MDFADALKAMRRNIFVHGDKWRTAVICPKPSAFACAWDEASYILSASSLGVKFLNYATRTIQTEREAIIRFFVTDDYQFDRLRGHQFTHIIIVGDPNMYPAGMIDQLRIIHRTDDDAVKKLWHENVVL